MTVLFIDDDIRRNRSFVNYLTKVEGWNVFWARSPRTAIDLLVQNREQVDFIILDVMMPPDETIDYEEADLGLSTGILLIDRIAQIMDDPPKILVLTGRRDLSYLQREGRIVGYLIKPQMPDEVASTIKRLMQN